ncbi:FAD-dependent oxidoreductase [Microbulbifer sp. SSSA005]|uniref:FAD-dependent oxidoreductase n=1 Tax=Microbulbifer sp. SSSA005 TaxID=3243378 RepID=UPI004039428E
MAKTVDVDVLVLGGGIQAISLLRELSTEFSVLAIDQGLDDAESLHFHGYFSSGWNAAHPSAAKAYLKAAQFWRTQLESDGVDGHITDFYAALPREFLDTVEPNWIAAGIPVEEVPIPAPLVTTSLPSHQCFRFADDLMFDGAEAYRRFSAPVSEKLVKGSIRKFDKDSGGVTEVSADIGGSSHQIKPQLVLSACGAGNAAILESLGVPAQGVRDSQVVRPLHMLLAKGANTPPISAFLMDMVVAYHPLESGEGLWILTLNPEHPRFRSGVVDMRVAPPIERALIRDTLDRLANCMTGFEDWAAGCHWGVYAGWKTDAPGPDGDALVQLNYPRPYHIRSFDIANFLAVWPNHWGLAVEAAKEAGKWVRSKAKPRHPQPEAIGSLLSRSVGHQAICNKWQSDELKWHPWAEFVQKMGLPIR